ncbi:MAG: membrane protein insertion efficiency factor YidD [Thermoanaerobaculia bacterium]
MSANLASPASTVRRGLRRRLLVAGLAVAALLIFDWTRAPARQISAGLELAAIGRYQAWISPWLQKGGVRCRFTPSCSHYAAAVVARDGFVTGNLRALGRLMRCGPWTNAGTVDRP